MSMMFAIVFILVGFAIMEFSGWFIHKYIMHGPLWKIHKTHHQPSKTYFELNDLFSLLFGSVSIILIIIGVENFDYRFWIGVGISLYGLLYFIIHDVLVHRRVRWFERPNNNFLLGIFRAHQAHHATNKKEDAVSFGLFIVHKKYFKH
jgi:beta-carotene 3-hydroxylase